MIEFDIPDVKYKSRFLTRHFKLLRQTFRLHKKDIRSRIKEYYSTLKSDLGIRFEFSVFIYDEWVGVFINSKNELQMITPNNKNIIIIKCTTLDNAIRNYSRK